MDFDAILEALDQRTRAAIKAATEPLYAEIENLEAKLKLMAQSALAEGVEQSKSVERMSRIERQLEQITVELPTQKQVREEVDAALARAPIPTYKGVFDRDAEYQAGDMVTHKGSVWHCNGPIAGHAPGTDPIWTLAVKCGRDGKDLTGEPA